MRITISRSKIPPSFLFPPSPPVCRLTLFSTHLYRQCLTAGHHRNPTCMEERKYSRNILVYRIRGRLSQHTARSFHGVRNDAHQRDGNGETDIRHVSTRNREAQKPHSRRESPWKPQTPTLPEWTWGQKTILLTQQPVCKLGQNVVRLTHASCDHRSQLHKTTSLLTSVHSWRPFPDTKATPSVSKIQYNAPLTYKNPQAYSCTLRNESRQLALHKSMWHLYPFFVSDFLKKAQTTKQ